MSATSSTLAAALAPPLKATTQTSGVDSQSDFSADSVLTPRLPRSFGDYELLEEIARGGMGLVYRARQKSLDRIVALKTLLFGPHANADLVRRFKVEAVAAGSLHHPNIVAVHEVGIHDGEHFLVMDYVDGPNLSRFVREQPLPAKRAANYLKGIAEAIAYAHEKGILHRDLKPSNVLIDSNDQPRVTDFGLAKRLPNSEPGTQNTELTLSGQVLGSPNYMPPEQAGAKRIKVGKHSDVYGLGAILYQLLTARPPFQGESITDTLQQVLHNEPVSPRLLQPRVPVDLETICLKCLQKEPERRYASAREVAEELGRFLNEEPIHARPVTRAEKAWRWCRKHPAMASLSAVSLILLLAVAIGGPIAATRIAHGRQEARSKAAELEETLYFHRVALAYRDVLANQPSRALSHLQQCPATLRNWEWNYVHRLCFVPDEPSTNFNARVSSLAFSPNGKDLATVTVNGVQLWNLTPTSEFRLNARLGPGPSVDDEGWTWVAFSPDGAKLAGISTNFMIKVWDVARRIEEQSFAGHSNRITGVAFHPSGKSIATASMDRTVRVWEVATGEETQRFEVDRDEYSVAEPKFSRDGRWLAAGTTGKNQVKIWELASGREALTVSGHTMPVGSIAFSPDGQLLASAGGAFIKITHIPSGRWVTNLSGHKGFVSQVVFSPDGSRIFSGSVDRDLKIWETQGYREIMSISRHRDTVTAIAFSADGQRMLTSDLSAVRLWEIESTRSRDREQPLTLSGHTNRIWSLAFAPGGRQLISAGEDRNGFVWDLEAQKPARKFESLFYATPSADGRYLASCGLSATTGYSFATVLDATSLSKRFEWEQEGVINVAVIAPAGDYLAASAPTNSTGGRALAVWDFKNSTRFFGEFSSGIMDLQFSPLGNLLASAHENGVVMVWDAASLPAHTQGRVLLPPTSSVDIPRIAFSHDGTRIAAGDGFDDVLVLDVKSGKEVLRLQGHGGTVLCTAYSPGGRFIASGGRDSTVRLWDARTGKLLRTLLGHRETVAALAFSPDGKWLASGSHDSTIKLWRLRAD